MKWMIASDIHGSALYCRKMLEAYKRENAERLLLLGDILYHGPRNDLPEEYAPKQVIEMLNAIAGDICCVRGNCEAEVDQMVLSFPVLADYMVMPVGSRLMYVTHGHVYSEKNLPPLHAGDILLYGHTHVPLCSQKESVTCLNPGSVAIPKEDSWHGYMTLKQGQFLWRDLEGTKKMDWTAY